MTSFRLSWILALLLPVSGIAAPETVATNRPVESYMRVSSLRSNVPALQIAMRKMTRDNRSGPVIWLVGASHIGDAAYYKVLQEHLNKQTLVLYEGVGGGEGNESEQRISRPRKEPPVEEEDDKLAESSDVSSLQSTLAQSLGLVFQSEAIDYSKGSFRNSDLSIEELQTLIAQSGPQSEGSKEFNRLLQLMDGSSMVGSVVTVLLKLIGTNPKLQGLTRLALIETLGRVQGDMSQMQGLPASMKQLIEVLIQKRNEKVVQDVKHELKKSRKPSSIAIFYGAGHMDDMQARLQKELGYRPMETRWVTAFSVDMQKMGITQAEVQTIRSFVNWQLETLQKPAD